ncbi:hypothetical protein A9B99_03065 [Mangrovibacter phragmitis]|jgi:multiple stress resistance protein BhsA|uniref:YdgH/BhsA/McbA-like domain-containing protein n=1 Tax=Mangrovibacter phragmitis TaxID=1691903 RepID=A0A1B7L8N1_9ENTR|nr:DUF1471 domain-containing protein [Mangrovibacter phragmitis]OAT78708.1 hypothetical protein A9B99_03065 [Mangrovibacter phragmitis]
MKKRFLVPGILALAAVSFSSLAAQEVASGHGRTPDGVVSTSGQQTLADVTQALQEKAQAAGASSFRIISADGNNQYFGVAELYK